MKELEDVLGKLKKNKAGGPDNIQICFLKELSPLAKERLLHLYNCSFREGITPSSWRGTEMLPIDKPGKPHEFRPISLTNVLARTMEKLVLCRLGPWIESILLAAQAGFRKYRSCEEQVSGFTEDIAQAM